MHKIMQGFGNRFGAAVVALSAACIAMSQVSFSGDARWTYLRTNSDPSPGTFIVNLAANGFSAGQLVQIESTSLWGSNGDGGTSRALSGVFSSSNAVGATSVLNRVSGAIDAGTDFMTPATAIGGLATDIPEDFEISSNSGSPLVTIQIPNGASFLMVSPVDSRFSDNSGNFEFSIRRATPKFISGRVNLQDFPNPINEPVTIQILRGNSVVQTLVTPLTNTGNYTVFTFITGTFDVRVKGQHWLADRRVGVDLSGNVSNLNFDLVNGDVDGDNSVTIFDYIDLSQSFDLGLGDAGYNDRADLDGDNLVTIFDYIILSNSFDLTGDD